MWMRTVACAGAVAAVKARQAVRAADKRLRRGIGRSIDLSRILPVD
jgi:hypothetical protein